MACLGSRSLPRFDIGFFLGGFGRRAGLAVSYCLSRYRVLKKTRCRSVVATVSANQLGELPRTLSKNLATDRTPRSVQWLSVANREGQVRSLFRRSDVCCCR